MKTIRTLRRERGWTQFELALKVGVQPQAVYFWESGRRIPQVPQLRKLGHFFDMCSDEIELSPAGHDRSDVQYPDEDADPGDAIRNRGMGGRVNAGDGGQLPRHVGRAGDGSP